MVDDRRAVDDLHTAVAVHVGGGDAVIALAGQDAVHWVGAYVQVAVGAVEGVVHGHKAGIHRPGLAEMPGKEVVGHQRGAGVVAAADDQVGVFAVQVGHARIEAVHPVAGLDAGHGIVAPQQAVVHPAELEGDGLPLHAVAAEHGQVFGAFIDEALELVQLVTGAAGGRIGADEIVGQRLGVRLGQRIRILWLDAEALLHGGGPAADTHFGMLRPTTEHVGHVQAVIPGRTDVVVLVGPAGSQVLGGHGHIPPPQHAAVGGKAGHAGARRGLDGHFGPAVAVEVIDDELGVVGAGADVGAHVQAPQQRAVQLVAVDQAAAGVALDGHVLAVGGVPLDEIFHLAVAVHIAHAHVVGAVGKGVPRRGDAAFGLLQGQIIVAFFPHRHRAAGRAFHPGQHGGHGIGVGVGAVRVQVVGAVPHFGQAHAVFVDDEVRAVQTGGGDAVHLGLEQPPADEHAGVGPHRHQAPGQSFQLGGQDPGDGSLEPGGLGHEGAVGVQRPGLEVVRDVGGAAEGKGRVGGEAGGLAAKLGGHAVGPVHRIGGRAGAGVPGDGSGARGLGQNGQFHDFFPFGPGPPGRIRARANTKGHRGGRSRYPFVQRTRALWFCTGWVRDELSGQPCTFR